MVLQVLASNENAHLELVNVCVALLANLSEHNEHHREMLRARFVEFPSRGKRQRFIAFLVEYYLDNSDGNNSDNGDSHRSDDDAGSNGVETVSATVARYNRSVSAAYASILIGCLAKSSKNREIIAKSLPNHNFDTVILTLNQFLQFQSNAGMLTQHMYDSLTKIIQELTSTSPPTEEEDKHAIKSR